MLKIISMQALNVTNVMKRIRTALRFLENLDWRSIKAKWRKGNRKIYAVRVCTLFKYYMGLNHGREFYLECKTRFIKRRTDLIFKIKLTDISK